MLIGGWQKTTLIDFPGRVASTIFTVGCNFRCPYCHNPELVVESRKSKVERIGEKEVFEYLEKKRKIIDGVCITGGEPTIQKDVVEFCRKVKDLGLEIKLDTNGSNPEVVEELIKEKLVNYVAVDVKNSFEKYIVGAGLVPARLEWATTRVARTLEILIKSGIDFELRTTVVPGMHDEKIIKKMAEEIKEIMEPRRCGVSVHWWLQNFRGGKCLDKSYNKKRGFTEKELNKLRVKAEEVIKGVKVRES